VSGIERALDALSAQLDAIAWLPLLLGITAHLVKMFARSSAWHGVLQFAYPESRVKRRTAVAAYVSGVGANAIVPARGGDLLRLYLVKRRVAGTTYTTLAATLAVEAILDALLATLLVLWALWRGFLPGLDVLSRLPNIDWLWVFERPRVAAFIAVAAVVLGFTLGILFVVKGREIRDRLAQGVAILRTPSAYVRRVVVWQIGDWLLRGVTVACFLAVFGIDPTLELVVVVLAAQSLSTLLPLTPAGIGTEQALLVYALSGEASTAAVLSFSVGMRLILIAVNVAAAAVALLLTVRTLRWRDVVASDARPEERAQAETPS
jgi:uncharacterized membrane protein YbhN (UPF0104 family)